MPTIIFEWFLCERSFELAIRFLMLMHTSWIWWWGNLVCEFVYNGNLQVKLTIVKMNSITTDLRLLLCISFIHFIFWTIQKPQNRRWKKYKRQISMATHCDRHLTLPKWSNSCSTDIQWFFYSLRTCTFLRYFYFYAVCFERVGMCGSCVTKAFTWNLKSLLLFLLLFGFFWLCITFYTAVTSH